MAMQNDDMIDSRFLKTCDIPVEERGLEPFTMVIFGGAGDLSKRKLLPSIFHLYKNDELLKEFSILGFDRIKMSEEEYRNMMREAIADFTDESVEEDKWTEFSKHLYYFPGVFEDDENFEKLIKKIMQVSVPKQDRKRRVVYYMAVPPVVTPVVIDKLERHNLCKGRFHTNIIVEKPFGSDRSISSRIK